ncbi:MAG: F0F1 ATP synthase subunit A [Nannocystis sp.]|nr:F0F1 ATP synthase subunit A [Nannocystis sp.]
MNPLFTVELFGVVFADTIFVTAAVTLLLSVATILASRALKVREITLWQAALEYLTTWISGTIGEIVDEDPRPYVPLIGTLVLFIAVCNLLALIPRVRPPTADLATAAALALVVFGAVPYFGIRRRGLLGYLKLYIQPNILLLPLNLFGELTRTLALAVRLFGNIMSGQMIGAILLTVAGALVPVPILLLGVLTGLVQAYIFGVLAAVYIAAAVQVETSHKPEPTPPEPGPKPQEAPQGTPA